MFTPEAERQAWDKVPVKRSRKPKDETAITKTGYSKKELENMVKRLTHKGTFKELFNDLSFTAAFQHWAYSIWNYHDWEGKKFDLHDDFVMCTGLPGEVGEVLEIVKKLERDSQKLTPKKIQEMKKKLRLELGDVLYYLTMIASRHGIALDTVIKENVLKLEKRYKKRIPK